MAAGWARALEEGCGSPGFPEEAWGEAQQREDGEEEGDAEQEADGDQTAGSGSKRRFDVRPGDCHDGRYDERHREAHRSAKHQGVMPPRARCSLDRLNVRGVRHGRMACHVEREVQHHRRREGAAGILTVIAGHLLVPGRDEEARRGAGEV